MQEQRGQTSQTFWFLTLWFQEYLRCSVITFYIVITIPLTCIKNLTFNRNIDILQICFMHCVRRSLEINKRKSVV